MWDDSSTTLTALADILEAFIERWDAFEGGAAPDMQAVLPAAGDARRPTLIELIKIDLEYRWLKHNLPRRMEEYLRDFPELDPASPPLDLLYEEYHLRRQSGLNVDPREFVDRFPELADELARLLGVTVTHHSTSLGRGLRSRQLPEFRPGERLDEFDLLAFLGKGAFAQVFLARQRSMQRLVALKISADYGTEPQTLAQLDHDHIVRVYDLRALPERKVQLLYMQYLAGGTLQSVVETLRQTPPEERTGRVLLRSVDRSLDDRGESSVDSPNRRHFADATWPEAVASLGAKLAGALEHAHRHGVLHRDIKPANVLLTADAVPKLADFNISFSSEVVGATPAAFFGGSLGYMSPEQIEAFSPAHPRQPDSLDGRTDLYSLAIVLWELLTGNRPFADVAFRGNWTASLESLIVSRRAGPGEAQRAQLPADCPPGLSRVLFRALASDPEDRWQTGAEFARQLELCVRPDVEALLYPPKNSLRAQLRPWAVIIAVVAATLPNCLATIFNILYNFESMIRQNPEFQAAFQSLLIGVNVVAYPLGLGILAWLTWTVQRRVEEISAGATATTEELAPLRRRALRLGHAAALIGVVEWCLSGMAFPIILHLRAGLPPPYLHFLASLVLCGLIAAAYPFFSITLFSLRVLYPGLRPAESGCSEDRAVNEGLSRMAWWYLLTAAAVPLLGVATLAVGMAVGGSQDRSKAVALSVLGIGGFVGLLTLFPVFRVLQRDLETLRVVGSADRR